MTLPQLFVAAVALMEIIAGLAYAWNGAYRLALVWIFVGLANVAMYGVEAQ